MKYFPIFLISFFLLLSCEKNINSTAINAISQVFNNSEEQNNTSEHIIPTVPKEIDFAGEKINFDDWDLQERMDRELIINSFWHTNTILMLKRANRWFPLMKKILKEENIPEDLIYVAVIESGLTNAVSPAGAKGFWQIMEGTGKEHGLIINKEIDERYHLEKSTRVACQYLKKAYSKFGTWTLATAAYNRGINGIERDLKEQKVTNFFDLSLNDETSRYVFRIIAAKMIFENPREYGFNISKNEMYFPYQTDKIEISTSIENIYDWSISQGFNVKLVRKLNPWIIGKKITVNTGDSYTIELPRNKKQLGVIGDE